MPIFQVFMHLDMDSFFVSVAIRSRPELQGKPVVVTHSKGVGPRNQDNLSSPFESWSEIASCSYAARNSGIKNGMLLGEALKRCPDLIPVSYDFNGYRSVAQSLYEIVTRWFWHFSLMHECANFTRVQIWQLHGGQTCWLDWIMMCVGNHHHSSLW